ncbi:MAG: DUF1614 domain-containing protein [Thermoguttaceae bacterium]
MQWSPLNYFPLTLPFLLILSLLAIAVIGLIEFQILAYAYEKIGVPSRYVLLLLVLSLLGAYVNIPVAQLPEKEVMAGRVVNFFGMQYVVPQVLHWPATVIAVNVGGAIMPTCLSIFLLIKNRVFLAGLIGVTVVTIVVHLSARLVPGIGIATPMLIPPLVAAAIALLLSPKHSPAVAYIAGSLGTLLGADLLNLDKIQGLAAPVVSIGGAGTFDGIFLTGIVAVLLA